MILLDTSGLLAALFEDQNHHEACARVLREATPPLIMSPFVVAEADYLIQKFGGVDAELLFLEELARGVYIIATVNDTDIGEAQQLIEKYRDLDIGLADASTAVLAGIHECRDVLTLDIRHFRAMRFRGRRTFRILPADTFV